MTAGDDLRRRAGRYRQLALICALAGFAGLALAIAFWMPPWGETPAFRRIAIDWHIEAWWRQYFTVPHHASNATGIVELRLALGAVTMGLGFAGLVLLFRRRQLQRLGWALIVLASLVNMASQGIGCRGAPPTYIEAAELTPALAERLKAMVRTPVDVADTYHQILYPSWLNHGTLAINWGGDDFGPAAAVSEIHYILAQDASLAGNADETKAQLDAIDATQLPLTYNSAYRVNAMRHWVATHGYRPRGADVPTPLPAISVVWRPILSEGGVLLALLSTACLGVGLGLSRVLRRRAARIDKYESLLSATMIVSPIESNRESLISRA